MSIDATFLRRSRARSKATRGDALDLVTRVDQRVERGVARRFEAARLAEIQAAEQLADDQQVGALHALGLERRALRERRVADRRPQIREAAERLAQREQRRFGTLRRQPAVEFRMADRAEQHRVRAQGTLRACASGRPAPSLSIATPPIGCVENENALPGMLRDVLQDADRFLGDFGADAVAGQQRDLQ